MKRNHSKAFSGYITGFMIFICIFLISFSIPSFGISDGFKFEDKMTEETVITENSYSSKDISVTVTRYSTEEGVLDTPYAVADIYIRDPRCMQSYFAGFSYERGFYCASPMEILAPEAGAILAINGDYYTSNQDSFVVRNGVLYREPQLDYDALALYEDGTMKVYSPSELITDEQVKAAAENAWQIWSFGPSLLDDSGKALKDFNSSIIGISNKHPRTAIGYYEPGHYCFVIIEGRVNGTPGATFEEMSFLFESLGCTIAYNLDGGASSSMFFNNSRILDQSPEERCIPDIILITEYEGSFAQKNS
ncbi:MAG: phosphodiester glycosidase family protein [Eubacteriales bacterium]|nr:phosphodiester glycosidase family protein [Eubacteriales bacterium]